jgi:hypothetical protein
MGFPLGSHIATPPDDGAFYANHLRPLAPAALRSSAFDHVGHFACQIRFVSHKRISPGGELMRVAINLNDIGVWLLPVNRGRQHPPPHVHGLDLFRPPA